MSTDVNPASLPSEADYQHTTELNFHPRVLRPEHGEDLATRIIEQQAAKLPSDFFLFLSLGAMAASAILELRGQRRASQFIGMWPSSLLMLGIYNKLVKTMGPA